MRFEERKEIIASIRYVDKVIPYIETTLDQLPRHLRNFSQTFLPKAAIEQLIPCPERS
jgi:glycerol-3-phosphate cytidylyltransferase-like family protein